MVPYIQNELVKILITESKLQSSKISKQEKRSENETKRIWKLEKALVDEKAQTDRRFDYVIERFDNSDN